MKAVIPAAGVGSRLRPLTNDRPKALVPVAGSPLLDHVFKELHRIGADEEFIVIVGYEGEQIIDRYGDSHEGTPITYEWQDRQEGLGDAILHAEPHIEGDEAFIECHSDNLFDANTRDVVSAIRRDGVDAVCYADNVTREEATELGVLDVTDGEVRRIVEKPDDPPSTLAQSGLFGLTGRVFDALRKTEKDRGELRLGNALDRLAGREDATVRAVEMDGWWQDVGYPEDRKRATEHLSTAPVPR